jgi:hypothetical protein
MICRYFAETGNTPKTIENIAERIDASKNAVANILYRTQRGAFVSEKARGHPRLRVWSLHPLLYARFSRLSDAATENE